MRSAVRSALPGFIIPDFIFAASSANAAQAITIAAHMVVFFIVMPPDGLSRISSGDDPRQQIRLHRRNFDTVQ